MSARAGLVLTKAGTTLNLRHHEVYFERHIPKWLFDSRQRKEAFFRPAFPGQICHAMLELVSAETSEAN